MKEDNYYFKLGAHQQWLIDYIEANPDFIAPTYRRNEVLGFLKNNTLEDLCISRPVARLNWGIPLPFDTDFVTYVWFDALVNYISIPPRTATTFSTLELELEIESIVAGGHPRHRQGHREISRGLLADHAQGDGPAAAETNSRPRLVAEGRREDQQEHRQCR